MKKKRFFIGILILLFLLGMYAKRERNFGEILDISRENIRKCSVKEIYDNGEHWEYKRVKIEDAEEFDKIWNMLDETKVSFKKWVWTSDLQAGEYCYEILIFDDSKHWIRLMENGEIQVLNMGNWVFEVSETDLAEGIRLIKDSIEKYQ